MSRTGPTSTSRPAYMTPMLSTNCAISPMSWPTRITAAFNLFLHPAQRLHHLALHHHVERAGWLIGNDDFRAEGMPIAIQTRCFMPPLSSCGYMAATSSGSPTQWSKLPILSVIPPGAQAKVMRRIDVKDLLLDAHHRVERVHRTLRDQRVRRRSALAHGLIGEPEQVRSLKEDGATGNRFPGARSGG